MQISGTDAVAWQLDDVAAQHQGVSYLSRQSAALVSGTSEIQRNIISERMLDLPRETATDRDLPFRDVRHNAVPKARNET